VGSWFCGGVGLVVGLDGFGDGDGDDEEDQNKSWNGEWARDVIQRAPDGLIKISAQRVRPQELDIQPWRSEKRPQDP
jgi:hypothetical protein